MPLLSSSSSFTFTPFPTCTGRDSTQRNSRWNWHHRIYIGEGYKLIAILFLSFCSIHSLYRALTIHLIKYGPVRTLVSVHACCMRYCAATPDANGPRVNVFMMQKREILDMRWVYLWNEEERENQLNAKSAFNSIQLMQSTQWGRFLDFQTFFLLFDLNDRKKWNFPFQLGANFQGHPNLFILFYRWSHSFSVSQWNAKYVNSFATF